MSPSKSSQQKTSRNVAIGEERDQEHTPEEVTAALEQLQADKKTPGFLKMLMNHMLSVQQQLCLILAKNQQLQDLVAALREKNAKLKVALAETDKNDRAHRRQDNGSANIFSCVDEKERFRSVVIFCISARLPIGMLVL
ncbi:unnamed protein product [Heligmosomoides polygyrus]|uniref:Uncharacterized protein n=1 Tax=Heligmosomoides polygyrus TaxID=6339 RepID=A0A183GNV0_HELPZ|nr:unnamed protein product [Heligmosomoides polygyrus]